MTGVVLILIAVAVLLGAQFLYYAVMYRGQRRQAELKRRLHTLAGPAPDAESSVLRERRLARNPGLANTLGAFGWARRLERLLLQTDLSWTVATVIGIATIGAVGAAVGVSVLTHNAPLAVAAAVAVAGLPLVWVVNARARRSLKLSSQLPDALDMMVRSLRAGHGVGAAMRLVAEEMPLPVAVEFGRCFEEQRLGVGLKEAVRNMALRVPANVDLKIFAVSMIIQHDTGGNLIEVLENIAATIRDRFKFYGKLRALTVEAKMSAITLGLLPFVCAGLVAVLNPKYLEPLWADAIGRVLVAGSLVLWAIGVAWMRHLSRVDY